MKKFIVASNISSHVVLYQVIIFFVLILFDFIWLRSLPKWNVSYGPGTATAILLSFFRTGLFVFWVILLFILRKFGINVSALSFWLFLVVNLLISGLCLYGFLIEPFRLTESHIEIKVPGLASPKRIVQISDIHVERITKREQALPQYIEALDPDMIVITGDLINETYVNNPQTINDLKQLIGELHAPLGVYTVNGNVETPGRLQEMFQDMDIHILDNKIIPIPEFGNQFLLVGLSYSDLERDEKVLTNLMSQTQATDFTFLLYHKPDLIYTASDLNVDVYLSGHTHGGQIRLPFYGAIFTNSRYGKAFEMGLYQVKNTILYVSRGLGFTGGIAPRIRFLAPPEVVTIDLVSE